jgi:hypothetical protein
MSYESLVKETTERRVLSDAERDAVSAAEAVRIAQDALATAITRLNGASNLSASGSLRKDARKVADALQMWMPNINELLRWAREDAVTALEAGDKAAGKGGPA